MPTTEPNNDQADRPTGSEASPPDPDLSFDAAAYWAMVNASPDALLMVDRNGKIEMVNRQTEALFGYDRADLLGCAVEALIPPRFAARLRRWCRRSA